jgi:glycine/D-amino acid oxidase-like deaminating enzyme
MSVRHVPFWLDRVAKTRRPAYEKLKGASETTVAVVGGGLTGCACAFSFAAAGIKVVLLEAGAIGAGNTAGSIGLVRDDFDTGFAQAAARHGLRPARHMWQAMHRASLDLQAAIRRLDARCDLSRADLVEFVPRSPDPAKRLRREYESRREAGLEHSWMTPASLTREAAIETGGGIRTHGATLDPYRACLAFAAGAAARGAAIYERSEVLRVQATRKHVDVGLERGRVRADAVVIATGAPLRDLKALRRHLDPRHRYVVVTDPLPAVVKRETGRRTAALRDAADPPHALRWLKDDRVMFAGGDQHPVPARLQEKTLVQRTGQLMYELSTLYPAISGIQPAWSWQIADYRTVDGLPFAGLHRNFPRHLFAISSDGHGAAFAWLAARILLRQFQGDPAKADEFFGFTRVL